MQKTKIITEKNELDDKEKENYREYDYFINILEELPEPSNLKDHYYYRCLFCNHPSERPIITRLNYYRP